MKKTVASLALVVLLSAVLSGAITVAAETAPADNLHFVIVDTLDDMTDLTEQEAPMSSYTSNARSVLADEDGDKAIQIIWKKKAYMIAKLNVGNGQTVEEMNSNAYGFGFRIETGELSVDYWYTMSEEGGDTYHIARLYSEDGRDCGTVGDDEGADGVTIPAGFNGYLVIPFGENSKAVDFSAVVIAGKGDIGAILKVDNFGYYTEEPTVNVGTNAPGKLLNFVVTESLEYATDIDNYYTGTNGTLVSDGGNKAIQFTWDTTGKLEAELNVSNGKTIATMNAKAPAFGFYLETGESAVKFDKVKGAADGTEYPYAYLYTNDGMLFSTIGPNSEIPANFIGYIVFPFTEETENVIDMSSLTISLSADAGGPR